LGRRRADESLELTGVEGKNAAIEQQRKNALGRDD